MASFIAGIRQGAQAGRRSTQSDFIRVAIARAQLQDVFDAQQGLPSEDDSSQARRVS
jgi:Arc/MetJ-type ribon-helix-helix transcriptional regulator